MEEYKQNGKVQSQIIYGIRKEWNDPRFRENFELLARKGSKWLESHSPKVGDQRE
jgi:hypothetical protein